MLIFNPPDFSDETMRDTYEKWDEAYGPNVWVAYAVYDSLKKHGIYYTDFRPSNMNVTGLPGLEPVESPDDDDF